MLFTKNFCRSQNKFADIRNKITGASCSKLSRYCAVIIAEENGIAYICRTTSGGTGKPIVETHGENGGWFRSPFLLPTKKGALLPPCISSYLHRLKYKPSINKKDKAKRDYQSSPTEGKRKKTCPNSRIYLFINICPMGMYSIVSHKVIKKNISSNRYAVFLPIFYPTGCYYPFPASAAGSIHKKACICPYPWKRQPINSTSDRQTIGKKQHTG